ncbi:MAG: DUF2147 domain-containing protein [Burkholderiaceae bacterium]
MRNTVAAAACLALHAGAFAQATPVGLWKTIDDETQREKSWVRIVEAGGILTGKVERIADPAKQDSKCDKCSDERKDKPVLGMTLVRNTSQNVDDKEIWDGGDILDPNNGKVYRLRLKPLDGGKALEVRGYIGPFFRNQTWLRAE